MFERSLRLNPDNVRVRRSLAAVYAGLLKPEEAEKHFRLALEVSPDEAWAAIGLGKSLCDQGKYTQGIKVYESVRHAGALSDLLEDNKKASYGVLQRKYKDMLKVQPLRRGGPKKRKNTGSAVQGSTFRVEKTNLLSKREEFIAEKIAGAAIIVI